MENNNCTNNKSQATTSTSTKIFEGKSFEEIIHLANDMFPQASVKTYEEAVSILKNISSNAMIYTAEINNAGIDTEVAMEAIKRIQADQEKAKKLEEEAKAREKAWMTVGNGKIWQPVYAYAIAVSKSAYVNPVRSMVMAIANALTASSDKVHTSTVLSLKLTQSYAEAEKDVAFLRQLNNMEEYMGTILETMPKGSASSESGYYQLQDVHYAVQTWLETVKPE